jgi:hypothetical protein
VVAAAVLLAAVTLRGAAAGSMLSTAAGHTPRVQVQVLPLKQLVLH